MDQQKEHVFEGTEIYTTPKSFLCSLCCNLVIKNTKAAIHIYSSVDDDPFYIMEDEEDDLREFTFVRLCTDCGGDHA